MEQTEGPRFISLDGLHEATDSQIDEWTQMVWNKFVGSNRSQQARGGEMAGDFDEAESLSGPDIEEDGREVPMTNRVSRITAAVILGIAKADFVGDPLSAEEDALWDAVAAEVAANPERTFDPPNAL